MEESMRLGLAVMFFIGFCVSVFAIYFMWLDEKLCQDKIIITKNKIPRILLQKTISPDTVGEHIYTYEKVMADLGYSDGSGITATLIPEVVKKLKENGYTVKKCADEYPNGWHLGESYTVDCKKWNSCSNEIC